MGVLFGAGATATRAGVAVGEGLVAGDGVGVGDETCPGEVVGVGTAAGCTVDTSVGAGSWVGVGAGIETALAVAAVDSTVSVVDGVAPGPGLPDEQPIAINRPRARASPRKIAVRGGRIAKSLSIGACFNLYFLTVNPIRHVPLIRRRAPASFGAAFATVQSV